MKFMFRFVIVILVIIFDATSSLRQYTKEDILSLREETRQMFQHAYDGYLKYASDYDELKPLSCTGQNTWGSYSLTLIDALDTLVVMGNYSEFQRVVDILINKMSFDNDINVSVFETNIRIVGGLLSAHLLSHKAGIELEPGYPCNGPLLRMAEDVARRLLPAFDTKTGMPYGTVNLKHGVPNGETSVTCTAGIGTFIIEFGALSRLTGDPIYEEVALNSLYSLYSHRSQIGLFGNHIDVMTGNWIGQDAGIGAGVDSYYEYLVKGSIMLNRPELMHMFNEGRKAIDKFLKRDDWFIWASMNKGTLSLPVFQSLEAFFPGVLSLLGDVKGAMRSLHNYHTVWKQYGFLPEFYNIPNSEASQNRESYPLRPELIESVMYLYRATGDPYLLEVGEDILRSIQYSAKTSCGYATIKNVRDHRKEDRMESFFLAETTKYLYLLFDPDNFLNNDGSYGTVIDTPNGECIIESGYVFNTEAHPIDHSALKCCFDMPRESLLKDFSPSKFLGDLFEPNIEKMENDDLPFNNWMIKDEENEIQVENIAKNSNEFKKVLVGEIMNALINASKIEENEELKNKFSEVTKKENNDLHIVDVTKPKDPTQVQEKQVKEKDDSLVIAIDPTDSKKVDTSELPEEIVTVPTASLETDDEKLQAPPSTITKDKKTNVEFEEPEKSSSDSNKETVETQNKSTLEKDFIKIIGSSDGNNSILSDLMQALLKPATQKKFDPQDLLNRIRMQGNFRNSSWNNRYELLTCKSQPYLQRMSVLGEFF